MNAFLHCKTLVRTGIIASICVATTISNPVYAANPSPSDNAHQGNAFTQFFNQIQQSLNSLEQYFNQLASGQFQALSASLGKDISPIISNATGVLGIPDPFQSRSGVQKAAKDANSTIYSSPTATNAVDGQIARGTAASVLSKTGQEGIQREAQSIQNAVTTVGKQAQTAVSATSTQDVVKQMAQQNAQNSAIIGSLNTNMQRQLEAQHLGNIQMTNISSAVTGTNQSQNLQNVSAGRENFKRSAAAKLF